MGTTSKCILLLLGLSTCCSALPRRGSDFSKPILPKTLEEAGAVINNNNNAGEGAATRSIVKPTVVQDFPADTIVQPLFKPSSAEATILNGLKKIVNGVKFAQFLNAPLSIGSGDNNLMKKIGDYLESFRIVKKIRDRCSDDKTKDKVSCTTTEVHGFYDFFGEAWHKINKFVEKWYSPFTAISDRVTEIKDDKEDFKTTGGTTVVTKPNTYFANFLSYLDLIGLDGKPSVVYDKEEEEKKQKEKEKEQMEHGKTPQQIKEDALLAGDFHLIQRIEKHNYWQKTVNAGIKLAGLGIFGTLCFFNCGVENAFGLGDPLPPLDPDTEAANQAAAAADAAGDTDGDGDVDADDARRRDTIVDDTYHGYDHLGEYVPYGLQQPQLQHHQETYVKDGRDPGYAYGTYPGWYPPEVNVNSNHNHLVEPEQHPDFSSRLLHSRKIEPQPIIEDVLNEDHSQDVAPVQPQPVYRGGRMYYQG